MVTMENEQLQAPPLPLSTAGTVTVATTTTAATTTATSTSNGRQAGPQLSMYSGIPDRQAVQVIQQALHRQPNTAAQYLQQMYAAQQQHLMLQTAALQQQHLGNSQLQSLAAVQQANLAANRQSSSSTNTGPMQTPPQTPTINLATSPAAAQLINRAQNVNSAAATASGIAQQAVLLGNANNPTLTASQAQMYLRAQMLIFTPTAAVTAVQPEGITTTATATQPSTTTAQIQNSGLRPQQTVNQGMASSSAQQLPTLAMKPTPSVNHHPVSSSCAPAASQGKGSGLTSGTKAGMAEHPPDQLRKGEGGGSNSHGAAGGSDPLVGAGNRTVTPVTTHPLIAPGTGTGRQPQPSIVAATSKLLLPSSPPPAAAASARPAQSTWSWSSASPKPPLLPEEKKGREPRAGLAAYSQLQSHQMASQPPPPKPAQHQFVIQQQQQIQPRLPSQLQANACANFGNSTGPQAQGHLPSQVTPAHLPSCQASNQHKAGANQPPQHLAHPSGAPAQGPLRPESGSPSRAAGCPNHGTQRRFQHASAVILQVQPSAGMPSVNTVENSRKDPGPGEKPPADSRPAPPHLPPLTSSMSPSAPPEPQAQECTGSQHHEAVRDSVRPPPDASSPGMTSGNGTAAPSTVAGAAPQNGENKPPQALVKPQILTHVIEGFVIQEGAEPFPVGRSSLLVGSLKKKYAQSLLAEKPLQQQQQQQQQQDNTTTTDSEMEDPYLQESKEEGSPPKLKCELCGRLDFAYKFKRSKRFCSMACAKRYNVGCTKRVGLFHPDRSKLQKANTPQHSRRRTCKATLPPLNKESKKVAPVSLPPSSGPLPITGSLQLAHGQEESSRCSDNSSYEEPLSPLSASSSASRRHPGERDMELPDVHIRDLVALGHHFLPSEPTKWNVEDVYEFIRSLPGCQEIAEEFRAQEIDGQALLLLKEDHLMSTMNIKLGPALKIYARICMLKES